MSHSSWETWKVCFSQGVVLLPMLWEAAKLSQGCLLFWHQVVVLFCTMNLLAKCDLMIVFLWLQVTWTGWLAGLLPVVTMSQGVIRMGMRRGS